MNETRRRQRIAFTVTLVLLVLLIPIVNFLTPLFAGALMVHVYKRIERKAATAMAL